VVPARGTGAVSEGIGGGLIMVIWQPEHKGFSASHWSPGTSVADDARRLDCAKSLLGVRRRKGGRRKAEGWEPKMGAKSANATSMRHQSHPKAC
jgi:hypothetical protein